MVVTAIDLAIADRLRQARRRAGWSQERLAEAAHIDPTTLSKYEKGRFPLPLAVLAQMANALGVRLAKLVDVDVSLPRKLRAPPQQGRGFAPRGQTADLLKHWNELRPRDRAAIIAICEALKKL